MRTNTAWVTARVCGRRRVKRVPSPGFESMSIVPPSWRTSEATTSMPTPRPARRLTSSAVEKPGSKISMSRSLSLSTASWRIRPRSSPRLRIAWRLRPAPSSRHFQHDFRTFAADGDADRTFFRLARLLALLGLFQAVRDCVAEHVLQRRGHAFEHVAVEFALRVAELELGVLAQFTRRLAHDAAQARHEGVERHHAGAHQAFLQLRAHARLLQQQGFVLARQVVERDLQAGLVGGRFGQCARQLLQGREAVELQRVERRVGGVVLALEAGDDLRFRLDLEAAQLVAHTDVGLVHFRDGAAERTQLLLQAGAVDRDFAGVVDETVEQVGADAHLFLRCARGDVFFVAGQDVDHRRRQRLEFDRRGRRFVVMRGRSCRVRERRDLLATRTRVEFGNELVRHRDRLARTDARDHRVQAVEATFEQRHAVATEFNTVLDYGFEQRLHGVAEFANRHDAGHARAALERVQVALQADQRFARIRCRAQFREQTVGMVEQVYAFLDEDVDQFRIESGEVERFVRILATGLGLRKDGGDRRVRVPARRSPAR